MRNLEKAQSLAFNVLRGLKFLLIPATPLFPVIIITGNSGIAFDMTVRLYIACCIESIPLPPLIAFTPRATLTYPEFE
tara:strand:- start:771 stop:1004 length:234 start_codon:yes stop_codon:yes gene_type:complete